MKCSSHWLEVLPENESIDILRDLARSHAEEAGPYRTQLLKLIHECRFSEMFDLEIDYELDGLTPHAVKHASQAVAFFSKLRHLNIGVNREEAGMRKFISAEELCRETNLRLEMRRAGILSFPARVERVFRLAQTKIRKVLGDVPSLGDITLRFGPGATRLTKKSDASIRAKSSEGVSCSEELFPLVKALLRELPHFSSENANLSWVDEDGEEWDQVDVHVVNTRLNFVFKNAKTYRLIGVEPLLNLMYQLGYGIHMASRLAAFGVDIRDQSKNQILARTGSFTGALATLDLSSASDTVSREIVYELLPLDWAHVLARGRSRLIDLPNGESVSQEKFSAMGNGFTFPLETLIFWALSSSVVGFGRDSEVSVYGDDIVVPSEYYADVAEVLRYAGFNVNPEKSYSTGPFRESCGCDYFEGIDVRPYFQKEWVSGQSLFVLHNFYMRRGDIDRAERVRSFIHPALLIFGPDNYGDGHLIGDSPRIRPESIRKKGYSGSFFETFSVKSRKEIREDLKTGRGDFPAALYTIYMRGEVASGMPEMVSEVVDVRTFYDALIRHTVPALADQMLAVCTPISESLSGDKEWTLPGSDGYKKIKIYTLEG